MRSPLLRWLSLRVRLVCVVALIIGGFFRPYVPSEDLGVTDAEAIDLPQILLVEDGFLMKSSSLTQQGARRAYAEGIVHVVQAGDSIDKLSRKYGITADTIRWTNDMTASSVLRPGQELVILPVNGVLHTVARGQTISHIAELYSIPPDAIRQQNKLESDFIVAGQELIIPDGKPIVAKPTQIAGTPKPTPTAPGTKPPAPAPTTPAADVVPTPGVLQMPCNNCFFTQYFHPGHYAVDIQTRGGGPVFAAEEGEVIRAEYGWNGGFGNVVEVDHGNELVTLYAHNRDLLVKKGDKVSRGQQVAWMGNTGRVYGATGIHIHFEVRVKGVKKNPILYLR